jgi:hypothetical protein
MTDISASWSLVSIAQSGIHQIPNSNIKNHTMTFCKFGKYYYIGLSLLLIFRLNFKFSLTILARFASFLSTQCAVQTENGVLARFFEYPQTWQGFETRFMTFANTCVHVLLSFPKFEIRLAKLARVFEQVWEILHE